MAQFRPRETVNFFDHESVTVAGASTSLTAATYSPTGARAAEYALVSAETAQMRFRLDGTAPTTTVGHILDVGDIVELEGSHQIQNFRAIRTGGTSGALAVSYAR